jgi:hypothetical protein
MHILKIWLSNNTIRNHVHTNPCVCNLCLINHLYNCRFNYFSQRVIKTTRSHIFNYKMVLSCKCVYDLRVLVVGWKWRWKVFLYHSQLVTPNNIDENLIAFVTSNVVHKWWNNMWCLFQLEYIIIAYVYVFMVN